MESFLQLKHICNIILVPIKLTWDVFFDALKIVILQSRTDLNSVKRKVNWNFNSFPDLE